jgi:hypothetical protein
LPPKLAVHRHFDRHDAAKHGGKRTEELRREPTNARAAAGTAIAPERRVPCRICRDVQHNYGASHEGLAPDENALTVNERVRKCVESSTESRTIGMPGSRAQLLRQQWRGPVRVVLLGARTSDYFLKVAAVSRQVEGKPMIGRRSSLATRLVAAAAFAALVLAGGRSASAQTGFYHPNAIYNDADYFTGMLLAGLGQQPWTEGLLLLLETAEIHDEFRIENLCPLPSSFRFNNDRMTGCDKFYDGQGEVVIAIENNKETLLAEYGHQALVAALQWYLGYYLGTPEATQQALRERAVHLLDIWSRVKVLPEGTWANSAYCLGQQDWDAERCEMQAHLSIVFKAPWMMLTADILRYGGDWDTTRYQRFTGWLDSTVRSSAVKTEESNRTREWPPYGQNHRSWAIYNLLLWSHLKHDAMEFSRWQSALLSYVENTILPNGAMPNELARQNQNKGVVYSILNLQAIVAAAKVVYNHGGPNLFLASNLHGLRIRRAVQHLMVFMREPDAIAQYYSGTSGTTDDVRFASLLEPLAGYYGNTEFAEYAYCHPGAGYGDANDYGPTFTFPTLLYNPLTPWFDLSNNERLRFHSFSGGFNDFVATRGNWREEVDTPSTNRVYRQYLDSNVDATAVAGDPEWMDYEISARLKVRRYNASNLASVGLFARYIDDNNYYRFYYNKNTNTLRIEQKVNGTFTIRRSISYTLPVGEWHTFKVLMKGPSMIFYVDDIPMVFDTSSVPPYNITSTGVTVPSRLSPNVTWNGKVGLFAHRTDVMFDDVSVNRIANEEQGVVCEP